MLLIFILLVLFFIMSIPDKDTLHLFANSAGLCNFCKSPIVEEHFGGLVNFGERAHIHGKRKGSARFIDKNADNNSYSNLILLCAKHHKLVDDHPNDYPASALIKIKFDHEMRIKKNPLIQSHSDVAIITGIFSIYPMMFLYNIINTENLDHLNIDIFDLLDIQNSLEEYYQGDYPFKDPELQRNTEFMFHCLRNLTGYVRNQDVFDTDLIGQNNHASLRKGVETGLLVDVWKYFNLSRDSFNRWYTYCKNYYGV